MNLNFRDKIQKSISFSIKKTLRELGSILFDSYATKSYSQEGEDMILHRIFEYVPKGFYVDVGAHHPKRFSNTYFFYKRGWSGINIDAMPGSMRLFQVFRRRDINIEAAISNESNELTYFIFNERALNTFSEALAYQRNPQKYYIVDKKSISTTSLKDILIQHLRPNCSIDFFSIDVEGLDLSVLQSNDWTLFRPKCVLVEQGEINLHCPEQNSIYQFMSSQNYQLFAKTMNTLIFKDSSYVPRRS